ncbi:glycosyltransferase family 4 protein [Fuscovulum ytuae]|uniref:Glycosyltransferase family 4 protein n=1 Tax=Fuscovulum ytuae TaxID=3042299 RepID=A0ABY8Q6L6_9RHOB|nr:glycosyltransferase family 4 protein [Fuscovulum sp. YMD61]WGV15927.1 glycosyltransferase family 4 protein [Fuscovulum sp. YMD61]
MMGANLRAHLGMLRRRTDILVRRPRLGVHVWIHENPYSEMLYRQFSNRDKPYPMSDIRELDAFTRLPAQGRLLWIHSEASFSWGRTSTKELEASYRSYMQSLDRWSAKGGKLVWTVHDDGLHLSDPDLRRIQDIRKMLRQMADFVHVHSEAAKNVVIKEFGVDAQRIIVVKHPSYAPLYQDVQIDPSGAEKTTRRRLLCFGHIKAYKDYQGLAESLDTLGTNSFDMLTIAGKPSPDVILPIDIYKKNLRLELHLGFIPDEAVPKLFANTDFLVLPYRQSLTSGAVALAMGFGVPVIAPNLGGMYDSVPKECLPLIYDAQKHDGLTAALRVARDMTPQTYHSLVESCRFFGAQIHPDLISATLHNLLSQRGILV